MVLGLQGETPETVDTATVRPRSAAVRETGAVELLGKHAGRVWPPTTWCCTGAQTLPFHPNGMRFSAYGAGRRALIRERTYYSVGGGFVVDEAAAGADRIKVDDTALPYPFTTGAELLAPLHGDRAADQRRDAGQRAGLAVRETRSEPGCSRSGR